jgi:hypothetical protein
MMLTAPPWRSAWTFEALASPPGTDEAGDAEFPPAQLASSSAATAATTASDNVRILKVAPSAGFGPMCLILVGRRHVGKLRSAKTPHLLQKVCLL